MEALFKNQNLISNSAEVPLSSLASTKLVALYFTAHWCPPCRTFTPKLINFYKAVNESEKNIEIVFISFDRDEDDMLEYLDVMPWAAVPFTNEALREDLKEKFGVTGIPMLVVLKPDGSEITRDGYTDLNQKLAEAYSHWIDLIDNPGGPVENSAADEEEEVSNFSLDPVEGLVCDKGHSLIWHGDVGKHYKGKYGNTTIKCDYCKVQMRRSSWHCRECCFDLCKTCRDWVVNSPADPNQSLICLNGHPMRQTQDLKKFYTEKYLTSNYTCRTCNKVADGSNLHCRRCIFDVCNDCKGKIVSCANRAESIKCGQQHGLQWKPNLCKVYSQKFGSAAFRCDICSGTYMGSGSFNCEACTYDLCVKCMNEAVCRV